MVKMFLFIVFGWMSLYFGIIWSCLVMILLIVVCLSG